jgi:hypothetical protein
MTPASPKVIARTYWCIEDQFGLKQGRISIWLHGQRYTGGCSDRSRRDEYQLTEDVYDGRIEPIGRQVVVEQAPESAPIAHQRPAVNVDVSARHQHA